MKHVAKTSFKEEIRKVLVVYALVPVFLCSMGFLLILTLIWNHNLTQSSKKAAAAVSYELQSFVSTYLDGAQQFSCEIDIARFETDAQYAADVTLEMYHFLGEQKVRGECYLLNARGEIIYSTAGGDVGDLSWNILHQMQRSDQQPSVYMYREVSARASSAQLQIGAAAARGKETGGYVIFSISAQRIHEGIINPQLIPVIVTNRFHRVMLGDSFGFQDGMGKLAHSVRDAQGYVRIDSQGYYISRVCTQGDEFVIYVINESDIMFRTILLLSALVGVIVICIVMAIQFSAHVVSVDKTRIVDEIVQAFHNAEQGDLKTYLQISSNDEFTAIGSSYNKMVDSLRNLIERNRKQGQETVLARIKQMESQFHPHFLFNSLESIRFMIRLDPQGADQMIICLSRLLRYSIKNDTENVPLAEEMAYTQDYLQMLLYRFAQRFQCNIDLPDALRFKLVPPLLLQPIIENAVKYGMDGRDRMHMDISAYTVEQILYIEICDDGVGMLQEQLRAVRLSLERAPKEATNIGLYNVHQRIRLMYGEPYGLEIDSVYGEGTRVRLCLPLE